MRVYLAVLIVFSVTSLLWCAFIDRVSGIWLYDTNFHAFHDVLTNDQVSAICRTVSAITRSTTVPLSMLNVLWIIAGIAMLRSRRGSIPEAAKRVRSDY